MDAHYSRSRIQAIAETLLGKHDKNLTINLMDGDCYLGASILGFRLGGGQPILNLVDFLYTRIVHEEDLPQDFLLISLCRMPWWGKMSVYLDQISNYLHEGNMRWSQTSKIAFIDLTVRPVEGSCMAKIVDVLLQVVDRFMINRIWALIVYHTICDSPLLRSWYIRGTEPRIDFTEANQNEVKYLFNVCMYLDLKNGPTVGSHKADYADDNREPRTLEFLIHEQMKIFMEIAVSKTRKRSKDSFKFKEFVLLPSLVKDTSKRLKNVHKMIMSALKATPRGQKGYSK